MGDLRLDVMLTAGWPSDALARATALVAAGVDGLFTFENAHDVFFPLVKVAGEVDADLMTNVAIAFPRSPLHLAYAANDLQMLSGGRFRLGVGSQVRAHIEKRYGSTWSRPAARMRELVLAVNAIFDAWEGKAPLAFRGEFTTHTLMTPNFDPGANPYGRPPVLVGALGPRMCEVAGEVSDGILVMPFNSERHFRERTVPAVERGLAARGWALGDERFEIVAEVIVAMGATPADVAAAREAVKGLLSFYASTPSYRPVLEVEGRADLQPELNALSKRGAWREMSRRVDDDLLHAIAVAGTPTECGAEIVRRFGEHAQRVCCYFPGYPVDDAWIGELGAALRQTS